MYTKVKNIQYLIALLKEHNVLDIVISAGSRHVPFVQSVENDSDFNCYSVVDERSAGYFAIGLYKQTHKPVAIVCTSSAATCNYYPAVYEARRQNVPLLVLTADRHPAFLYQLEDQMIAQPGMYGSACKKVVSLPWISTELDNWQCQRLINEALIELEHHGSGPVQINFPNDSGLEANADLSVATLPKTKVIRLCEQQGDIRKWQQKGEELLKAKSILVLVGAGSPLSKEEISVLEQFCERYNCVIATEKLSNLHCKGAVDAYLLSYAVTSATITEFMPDIIISFGGNLSSRYKALLRRCKKDFVHWNINRSGAVVDALQHLTCVFESSVEYFFEYYVSYAGARKSSGEYIKKINSLISRIKLPQMEFSATEAMYRLAQSIPDNSLLHLSILNSTRVTQLFALPENVQVYSNLGTYGIDGSMSTFLGQAAMTDKLCFLVIGDLSFFYDMNSLGLAGIGKNVRILLINNGGGAEFHFSMGEKLIPTINKHIAAEHSYTAENWIKANGFRFIMAKDSKSLKDGMAEFVRADSDVPVVMEVITSKQHDAEFLKSFCASLKLDIKVPAAAAPAAKKAAPKPAPQAKKNEVKGRKSFIKRVYGKCKKILKKIIH